MAVHPGFLRPHLFHSLAVFVQITHTCGDDIDFDTYTACALFIGAEWTGE